MFYNSIIVNEFTEPLHLNLSFTKKMSANDGLFMEFFFTFAISIWGSLICYLIPLNR